MPEDRDGKYWKPSCGVTRCSGRGCCMYSLFYQKCLILVYGEIWERTPAIKRKPSHKASCLSTIANMGPSLAKKTASKDTVAVAHEEQAKAVKLEDILSYDE